MDDLTQLRSISGDPSLSTTHAQVPATYPPRAVGCRLPERTFVGPDAPALLGRSYRRIGDLSDAQAGVWPIGDTRLRRIAAERDQSAESLVDINGAIPRSD